MIQRNHDETVTFSILPIFTMQQSWENTLFTVCSADQEKLKKISDSPVLTDRKKPDVRNWLTAINIKIMTNANRYIIEILKMTYIFSWVSETAADHLRSMLNEENSSLQAKSASNLINKLWKIFLDPNHQKQAIENFNKLYCKYDDNFHSFSIKFFQLVRKARIS